MIVGVLQGDDLAQMSGYEGRECVPPHPTSLGGLVQSAFPNLSERARPKPMGEAVAAEWKREAAEEIDRATPAERERFQAIDPRAQRAFLGGQLNPMILMTALRSPAPPDPLLFFELDTNLTPAGHRLFADSITPAIGDAVRVSGPMTQHASHP